jgi:hypothetical protein
MKHSMIATVIALLAGAAPSFGQAGQGTGGLPQSVEWGMQQAMRNLENESLGITEETMAAEVGDEVLASFIEGAVVRLVLSPDGTFTAYTLEGGDLVSFKLGKQSIELSGEGEWEDPWVSRTGDYEVPKRPQKLSLTLDALGQKVDVECFNKFGKPEKDVTYYVGPLNGLFCMGLADDETAG